MQHESNKGLVIAVVCLILGVVVGAAVMQNNSFYTRTQQGASLKSQEVESTIDGGVITTGTYPKFSSQQLEAQKKLKILTVFQNTPEEINAAFGVDPKTFTKKLTPDMTQTFDQVFGGGNSNDLPYVWCSGGVHPGPYYESPYFSSYYFFNCDWSF
jgi:hypothetical protein